ncbi:MAG: VIT1/CCC1 transporter family protein [Methylophilaceae bacterium]|nr:VIT1/CCC1 transporter family protein [Methylophilaceae bacterium]
MHALRRWKKDSRSAYLYRALSDHESGTVRQLLFLELAQEADQQAMLWAREARKSGVVLPAFYTPSLTAKVMAWLIRRLGPVAIMPLLASFELRGLSVYVMPLATEAPLLYATVTGMNRGLSTLLLLIMALASLTANRDVVSLVGSGGLLVVASIVATYEWMASHARHLAVSEETLKNRSERQRFPNLPSSKPTTMENPFDLAFQELTSIYRTRGMALEEALAYAKQMVEEAELEPVPLDVNAIKAAAISRTPWECALHGFFAVLFGGLIPLLPFLLDISRHPLLIAGCLAGLGLLILGACRAHLSGRSALWGGLKNLAITGATGGSIYLMGMAWSK